MKYTNNVIKYTNNVIKYTNNVIKYTNNVIKYTNNVIKYTNNVMILHSPLNLNMQLCSVPRPILFGKMMSKLLVK